MKSADVFLSYTPADRGHVDTLVALLQEAEIPVWFDERGRHGPRYRQQIEDTIEDCKVFLLLLSREALADERVLAQLAKARELGRMVQALQIEDFGTSDPQTPVLDELDRIEAFGAQERGALETLLEVLRDAGVERRPPEIFISYSSKDSERVHRLAQHLRDARLSVWIDRAKLRTGADWDKQLVQALKSCRIVIFARTEDSLQSEPVATELKLAKDLDRRILQLRLSGPMKLPDDFAFLFARDNFLEAEGKRDDVVLEDLLRELKKLDEQIDSDSRAVLTLREELNAKQRQRSVRMAAMALSALIVAVGTVQGLVKTARAADPMVQLPLPTGVDLQSGGTVELLAGGDSRTWSSSVALPAGVLDPNAPQSIGFHAPRLNEGQNIELTARLLGDDGSSRGRATFLVQDFMVQGEVEWVTWPAPIRLPDPPEFSPGDKGVFELWIVSAALRANDDSGTVLTSLTNGVIDVSKEVRVGRIALGDDTRVDDVESALQFDLEGVGLRAGDWFAVEFEARHFAFNGELRGQLRFHLSDTTEPGAIAWDSKSRGLLLRLPFEALGDETTEVQFFRVELGRKEALGDPIATHGSIALLLGDSAAGVATVAAQWDGQAPLKSSLLDDESRTIIKSAWLKPLITHYPSFLEPGRGFFVAVAGPGTGDDPYGQVEFEVTARLFDDYYLGSQ